MKKVFDEMNSLDEGLKSKFNIARTVAGIVDTNKPGEGPGGYSQTIDSVFENKSGRPSLIINDEDEKSMTGSKMCMKSKRSSVGPQSQK